MEGNKNIHTHILINRPNIPNYDKKYDYKYYIL